MVQLALPTAVVISINASHHFIILLLHELTEFIITHALRLIRPAFNEVIPHHISILCVFLYCLLIPLSISYGKFITKSI